MLEGQGSIGNTRVTYDAAIATPMRDRPRLPPGYITRAPKGMLSWASVQRMLRSARYLWIATTAADGSPHLVQQWGAWVDDTLYFEGSPRDVRWFTTSATRFKF